VFDKTFNGRTTKIGDINITLIEELLAIITGLEWKRVNWFKSQQLKGKGWKTFLNKLQGTLYWTKAVSRTWLDDPWKDMTFFIHKYLTCEGRYNIVFLYHIRLLQHLKDKKKRINMPYYLLKILTKIAATVHIDPPKKESFLYHHSLIKIIVFDKLDKLNQTWEEFPLRNNF